MNGFCPSFVTVEGGEPRRPEVTAARSDFDERLSALPLPQLSSLDEVFDLLVAGIGGTGVVTVGALITMAAHLEGRGATVLDFTGFAQKGGAVISHIRLGLTPEPVHQVRIADGRADAVVACDVVVGTGPRAVAINLYKVMAYKDEYEVARLYSDPEFQKNYRTLSQEVSH